jgi:hypothetical protein
MYVTHILLFLIFTAQVARAARRFDNPMYKDEFNVASFLENPDILIGQALTLRYKPVNLDVLPLFIALIVATPLMLWCLVRRPNWTLAGSCLLYVAARWFGWNFSSYPPGTTWYFNPFAWQLLFVFAAWCGIGGATQLQSLIKSRVIQAIAFAWIAFALVVVLSWQIEWLDSLIPQWLRQAIYPIDKTNLDMLRLTHFLALVIVIAPYLPRGGPLTSKWLQPFILCGRHSLALFCLGVFLSFGAHWILIQQGSAVWQQIAVSTAGILIMIAAAWFLDRAKMVPNLFVNVDELEPSQATSKSGTA